MQRLSVKSSGPGAAMKVPSPGMASSVGPKPQKARPAINVRPGQSNGRDYGKAASEPAANPDPFYASTRLGGI